MNLSNPFALVTFFMAVIKICKRIIEGSTNFDSQFQRVLCMAAWSNVLGQNPMEHEVEEVPFRN